MYTVRQAMAGASLMNRNTWDAARGMLISYIIKLASMWVRMGFVFVLFIALEAEVRCNDMHRRRGR